MINRYSPIILISLAFTSVILFFFSNKHSSYILVDTVRQKLELISWVFSGVMGVVSFLAIFISFVYDNNLIGASKNLRQINRPYGLSLEEFRFSFNEYIKNISRRNNVNLLFVTVLVTTILSIIVWGVAASLYNDFSLKLPQSIKEIDEIVSILLYAIWLLLSGLMTCLCHLLNHIRSNKDPLGRGFLPNEEHLLNIDYLSKHDVDFGEIFRIIAPVVEFHINPLNKTNGNEIALFYPMVFSNIRVVIKLYDEQE